MKFLLCATLSSLFLLFSILLYSLFLWLLYFKLFFIFFSYVVEHKETHQVREFFYKDMSSEKSTKLMQNQIKSLENENWYFLGILETKNPAMWRRNDCKKIMWFQKKCTSFQVMSEKLWSFEVLTPNRGFWWSKIRAKTIGRWNMFVDYYFLW